MCTGAVPSMFAFASAGCDAVGGVRVAKPQAVLGSSITDGDIIAELVELVVCALDKGELHMMQELQGEETTSRLIDGTPITMNMPCTLLTSIKGGPFRYNSEVQVVEIDSSGGYVTIQARSGETQRIFSNPRPFLFRDLQASINFDMLLRLNGASVKALEHCELEYSRSDPTAGDGCLNSLEMINMFKILISDACEPAFRSLLIKEFSSNPSYSTFPLPPAGSSEHHHNLHLARCLTHQLLTEDLNEFLQADKVCTPSLFCF
jgi:uncharacterized protein YbaR (Trm112 family)